MEAEAKHDLEVAFNEKEWRFGSFWAIGVSVGVDLSVFEHVWTCLNMGEIQTVILKWWLNWGSWDILFTDQPFVQWYIQLQKYGWEE